MVLHQEHAQPVAERELSILPTHRLMLAPALLHAKVVCSMHGLQCERRGCLKTAASLTLSMSGRRRSPSSGNSVGMGGRGAGSSINALLGATAADASTSPAARAPTGQGDKLVMIRVLVDAGGLAGPRWNGQHRAQHTCTNLSVREVVPSSSIDAEGHITTNLNDAHTCALLG